MLGIKGVDNCVYHVVSALFNKEKENKTLVYQQILKELKAHKESYRTL